MRLSGWTLIWVLRGGVGLALLLLPGCAETVDEFSEVTVYNGTYDAVRVNVDSEGLASRAFRLQALTGTVIAPGDQCRFTDLEISTPKGEAIGSYEGSVCPDHSLVLGEDDNITLEDK
jgi:hypothetical protein